jgi:hypothetical protein
MPDATYGPGDLDATPNAIAILDPVQRQNSWDHFQALVSHVVQDTASGAIDGKTDDEQAARRTAMLTELQGVALQAFGSSVTFQTEF